MKRAALVCAVIAVMVLVVVRFDDVLAVLGTLWDIAVPFLVGLGIAYLLNIVMSQWERVFFPHSSHPVVVRLRRPVCLVLALSTLGALIAAVIALLVGELRPALGALCSGVSAAVQALLGTLAADENISGFLTTNLKGWEDVARKAIESAGGAGGITNSVAHWGGDIARLAIDALIAVVFALYVLAGKERFRQGAQTFGKIVFSERAYGLVTHMGAVAHENFSHFVKGQCLEAVILGLLCALGMKVLGFPWAGSIGLCVGVTALLPYIGAWIGGAFGALMIASVSVEQALWFVVFLVILQQIEGHLIYPNVVGASVGMPGIWTFVAVVVGGSLCGFVGVLLGVPAVSTLRQLTLEWKEAHVS